MISLKKALERCNKVFVYGTLKSGYHNNRLLRTAKFIGNAITYKRFRLFDIGYPLAIPVENGYQLKGELYEIPSENILKALDWLEGYPTYYKRQVIKVFVPKLNEDFEAWIYYVRTPQGKEILPNENGIIEWKP